MWSRALVSCGRAFLSLTGAAGQAHPHPLSHWLPQSLPFTHNFLFYTPRKVAKSSYSQMYSMGVCAHVCAVWVCLCADTHALCTQTGGEHTVRQNNNVMRETAVEEKELGKKERWCQEMKCGRRQGENERECGAVIMNELYRAAGDSLPHFFYNQLVS